MKKALWMTMIVVFSVLFIFSASHAKPFKIAAIFQTAIEEPWDGVIHQACLQAKKEMSDIEYEFTEKIAAADFEKVLREYAERGFDLKPGEHPIIPVMLGDARLATAMADKLLARGIYVIGFSYPVVPKGQARIRTQISAAHEREHLDKAIAAFTRVGKELGVLK